MKEKTMDGTVGKLYDHFKNSQFTGFKNQLLIRVVDICLRNDYALLQDFNC
jgi:hypothetical protein